MRILILGDVMGRPARRAVRELVPALIREEKIDLAIANAENAAGGMGVDIKSAGELFSAGINVLTSGNHIWKKKEIFAFLDEQSYLLRPANYPEGAPGRGWCEWRSHDGFKALVINVQGRVFMPNQLRRRMRWVGISMVALRPCMGRTPIFRPRMSEYSPTGQLILPMWECV